MFMRKDVVVFFFRSKMPKMDYLANNIDDAAVSEDLFAFPVYMIHPIGNYQKVK